MNTPHPSPLVSIVLVTWNSANHLPRCLKSLAAQTFTEFEVLIIDNGSSDGALENIVETYPSLQFSIQKLNINHGFSVANNLGARLARGKWLALLNTDAFPEPAWLAELLQAANTQPEFNFFASRQLQASNPALLDGIGDVYHISGLAWRSGYNQPAANIGLVQKEVFSACAAASLYLREKFLEVGGFDEDYFSYFEDVDLSFRLRLAGGRCLYVPSAIVHHQGSASTSKGSDFAFYYGHRNLVWTYFKDMPFELFWRYLPLQLIINLLFPFIFLLRDRKTIVFKSKIDAFLGLPAIFRKRKVVQALRCVNASEIQRMMSHHLLAPHRASRARTQSD